MFSTFHVSLRPTQPPVPQVSEDLGRNIQGSLGPNGRFFVLGVMLQKLRDHLDRKRQFYPSGHNRSARLQECPLISIASARKVIGQNKKSYSRSDC